MRLSNPFVRWTLLLFALAGLSGCGNAPTGPAPVGSGGIPNPGQFGPDILVVHPDGTTSWTPAVPGGGANPAGSLASTDSTDRSLAVSEQVDGSVGVKMRCGRFYLRVPPGAFDGSGSITMSMEDSTVMICNLEIFPKELNSFRNPVQLVLCTNDSNASTDTLSMYWYDPGKDDWVDMGCDKDLSRHPEAAGDPFPPNMTGIITELSHFSRYSGGKAGW